MKFNYSPTRFSCAPVRRQPSLESAARAMLGRDRDRSGEVLRPQPSMPKKLHFQVRDYPSWWGDPVQPVRRRT
jgi:hypothetical protein